MNPLILIGYTNIMPATITREWRRAIETHLLFLIQIFIIIFLILGTGNLLNEKED